MAKNAEYALLMFKIEKMDKPPKIYHSVVRVKSYSGCKFSMAVD